MNGNNMYKYHSQFITVKISQATILQQQQQQQKSSGTVYTSI